MRKFHQNFPNLVKTPPTHILSPFHRNPMAAALDNYEPGQKLPDYVPLYWNRNKPETAVNNKYSSPDDVIVEYTWNNERKRARLLQLRVADVEKFLSRHPNTAVLRQASTVAKESQNGAKNNMKNEVIAVLSIHEAGGEGDHIAYTREELEDADLFLDYDGAIKSIVTEIPILGGKRSTRRRQRQRRTKRRTTYKRRVNKK